MRRSRTCFGFGFGRACVQAIFHHGKIGGERYFCFAWSRRKIKWRDGLGGQHRAFRTTKRVRSRCFQIPPPAALRTLRRCLCTMERLGFRLKSVYCNTLAQLNRTISEGFKEQHAWTRRLGFGCSARAITTRAPRVAGDGSSGSGRVW